MMTYIQRLCSAIWTPRREPPPRWQAALISAAQILHLVIRDLMQGPLTLRATSLVYTTLLSLVPLVAVSFSVLKGFGVHNQVEPLLLNLLAPLGEKGVEITGRIIEFVDNIKVGVLGSLGLAVLVYTVVSLVQKIEGAFNDTWHVNEQRSVGQRFSNYLSVILIGPVLIFTALGITASITSAAVVQKLLAIEPFGELIRMGTRLLPYLLVIAAFAMIYLFIPNTKVRVKSALLGALVAGFLWESAGRLVASFIASSGQYTAIYSALATLIVFMIWLYVSWLILLIGSSIAFYHQHPEQRTLQRHEPRLSNRLKEKLALSILLLIARRYYDQEEPWSKEGLARELDIPLEGINPVLDALTEKGIVVCSDSSPCGLFPAQPPDILAVADIVAAIRRADETACFNPDKLSSEPEVDKLFQDIEQSLYDDLHGKTLKQLLASCPESEPPALRSLQ